MNTLTITATNNNNVDHDSVTGLITDALCAAGIDPYDVCTDGTYESMEQEISAFVAATGATGVNIVVNK